MKILGVLAIFLQKQPIKGVIDFEEGEVLKIFGYAFNRQGFLAEGFIPDLVVPAGNPFFIGQGIMKFVWWNQFKAFEAL